MLNPIFWKKVKFDNEYNGDPILRKQHNTDKQINKLFETDMI